MSRHLARAVEQQVAELSAVSILISKIEAARGVAGSDEATIQLARDEAHSALDAQLDAAIAGRRETLAYIRRPRET